MYSSFVALSILQLEDKGELVAITPRSFCNGTYFKPFRKLLLENCSIRKVHVFESRKESFKDDDVLQENIIFHLIKGVKQGKVILSSSYDSTFNDIKKKNVAFSEIINPADKDSIIHLPVNSERQIKELKKYTHTLTDIGLSVSTGPVVDFRVKEDLSFEIKNGEIPLVYPLNFEKGTIKHPKESKKPNCIVVNERTQKLLMPSGYYVLTRRFSSKEEKHRVVSVVFDPKVVSSKQVGFDNHLNVFHENKKGFSKDLAIGLSMYLNSSYVDEWFRNFSGHTQVNAGDLRMLKYPDRKTLEKWGKILKTNSVDQKIIDKLVAGD
jgi:adenine-specific DNA-methyltransferase